MVLTDEQGKIPIEGFTVLDALLIRHCIEKLLRSGNVVAVELNPITTLYNRAVMSAHAAGIDITQIGNTGTENTEQGERNGTS